LHKEIENLAFAVNRAPQPELPARDQYAISSRCHRGVGRGRRRRSSRANIVRTSRPIGAPFRRTHRAHAQRADLRSPSRH
jgi:hypothetical protein